MTAHLADLWGKTTFGRLAHIGNGADYSSVEVEEGGYPVYGSGGEFRRASSYLFDGESVLFGRKGTVDRPLYVEGKFWTVDTMFYSVIDRARLLPRFAYYWATTLPFGAWATDTALPSMTSTAIKAAPIALPSLPEQRAIAEYLDRETAQIDAFIAKNEKLITLLIERRSVAVDRAIGWGTTPDVATGEWLGCVPSGWSLAPLRRWMRFITSGSRGWGQFYSDEGTDVFLRIGDLQRDRLELRPVARQRVELPVGEEGVRARTQSGDLLISITADLGSVAVIDTADAGAYVSQHVALVRLDKERLNSRFGAYVVSSSAGKTHFEKAAYGGTKIQLSLPDVREMPIAVPSLDEQVRIVQHLDAVTDDVDEAIETARRAIELARERRAALISAAVTGKIDVGVAV